MLDMGFIPAIRQILKLLPRERQNLMFSATYSEDIRALAARMLRDPVAIEVAARNATAERIEQHVYRAPKDHKRHLLAHLIKSDNWQQVLVFTRTKHGANRLCQQLQGAGIHAAAIHGNKSQGARVRALSDFKEGAITALVATEVAARGLDIKELPYVVNYELPNVPEDYVYRIGQPPVPAAVAGRSALWPRRSPDRCATSSSCSGARSRCQAAAGARGPVASAQTRSASAPPAGTLAALWSLVHWLAPCGAGRYVTRPKEPPPAPPA